MKPRKHVIYGWTSKRSRLTRHFFWSYSGNVALLRTTWDISRAKGRRSDWCAADWPPKRVRVTVEEV